MVNPNEEPISPGIVYISAEKINTNNADDKIEGTCIGSVMCTKVCMGVAPLALADSSRDVSIDRKLLDVNKYMSDVKNKLITQTIPLKVQILTMGSNSNPSHSAIPISVTLMKPVLTEPKAIHAIKPVKGDKNMGMMTNKSKTPLNGKSVLANINAKDTPNVTEIAVTMDAK